MALKRATRVGASTVLPLLCDDDMPAVPDERARLFAESLDVSVLGDVPATVARVTIRGLSGRQLADADEMAWRACGAAQDRVGIFRMVETIRRGLVAVSGAGFEDLKPDAAGMFPVEALADMAGGDWVWARAEISQRIEAWSHLGESDGSSSAPRAGEPTSGSAAAT